ncbi:MAG: hypothetical protein A4E19_20940 [Nitrospira sp. SG-bin1]|nr:MAG: hypothetical protein A4E19_20940 [Nitrospira sp. SG-bin1]
MKQSFDQSGRPQTYQDAKQGAGESSGRNIFEYQSGSSHGNATNVAVRLRILHLINNFELGGTENQAVLLLKHLDRTRYDIRLGALSTSGPLFEQVAPLYGAIGRYPLNSFYDYNALKQAIRLRSYLRENGIQIIHTHEFYSGILATVAALFTEIKVIASQRNLRMSDRLVHSWGRRGINALADTILVNAQAIKAHILTTSSVSPANIVVIKNGLSGVSFVRDPEQLLEVQFRAKMDLTCELGIASSSAIVGMVANFRPVKGHRHVLDAAARVLQRLSNVHFLFIGEGELRSDLERQTKELGIERNIHLMGHRTDARSLVAGFDVALLASLHEGMPNTVLEAMAAGVPVIATAVGGVNEIIEDGQTGYLVPPGDPVALAECLNRVLEHKQVRRKIGLQGQQFVQNNFTVGQLVLSVQELYESIVNRGCGDKRSDDPV